MYVQGSIYRRVDNRLYGCHCIFLEGVIVYMSSCRWGMHRSVVGLYLHIVFIQVYMEQCIAMNTFPDFLEFSGLGNYLPTLEIISKFGFDAMIDITRPSGQLPTCLSHCLEPCEIGHLLNSYNGTLCSFAVLLNLFVSVNICERHKYHLARRQHLEETKL